jgi:hypothetical protein
MFILALGSFKRIRSEFLLQEDLSFVFPIEIITRTCRCSTQLLLIHIQLVGVCVVALGVCWCSTAAER